MHFFGVRCAFPPYFWSKLLGYFLSFSFWVLIVFYKSCLFYFKNQLLVSLIIWIFFSSSVNTILLEVFTFPSYWLLYKPFLLVVFQFLKFCSQILYMAHFFHSYSAMNSSLLLPFLCSTRYSLSYVHYPLFSGIL